MHIEPGVVTGAKIILSYATAVGSLGFAAKLSWQTITKDGGALSFLARSVISTALVFCFFEVFPHHTVGISEVHLILGSTLFLIFGAGPAAMGLTFGLLLQGLFFAPQDLPQYGMNITTLLVPLYGMSLLANHIIPKRTAYKDISYWQALRLSTTYQASIVCWVAFWAFYGEGLNETTLNNVATFGIAYMSIILVEPVIDLAVLACAKTFYRMQKSGLVQARLYQRA